MKLDQNMQSIRAACRRMAKLADLNAPSVCLVSDYILIGRRLKALAAEADVDFKQMITDMEALRDEEPVPLTPEEVAEMEKTDREYDEAYKCARAKFPGGDTTWNMLDSNLRFNMVMAEWKDVSDA